MKRQTDGWGRVLPWIAAVVIAGLITAGCGRNEKPPDPIPEDQIPAAVQKAFNTAQPQAKELAEQTVVALQAKDYAKAFATIQQLTGMAGLNKEQNSVVTRATLTINSLLQTAETKGDTKAADTLKTYRVNK